jgi:hypothetical protein
MKWSGGYEVISHDSQPQTILRITVLATISTGRLV